MMKQISITLTTVFLSSHLAAVEWQAHGIADVRITSSDSNESYLTGGTGKFASDGETELALAQLAAEVSGRWSQTLSTHLVVNSYSQAGDAGVGVTEGYLKYKSLPSESGWRVENRTGLFYPKISLENEAFAWSSINTLNSSMLNTWIGEEIRLTGSEIKLTKLGKFSDRDYDLSVTATAFVGNDPAGALLSWHGWTSSNRQTSFGQGQRFARMPASAPGQVLSGQAAKSSPFEEVDDRIGYQVQFDWKQAKRGKFNIGYYDNRSKPYLVDDGQYGWAAKFAYAGARWKLSDDLELTTQYLRGSNLMQRSDRTDVVNNVYSTGFAMLTKKIDRRHKVSLRLEEFSVTDKDSTAGDNNDEYGKAATLNYTYRYSKPLFLSAEFNWVKSDRPSRAYQSLPVSLTEQQIQFAARYFF
ncbi:MAG: outer membrane beta-barrel protein [Pseudomonadales bacterium]